MQFIKHPISQTPKTEHIHIGQSPAGMQRKQILLHLQGRLFRHQDKKILVRVLHGKGNHLAVYIF